MFTHRRYQILVWWKYTLVITAATSTTKYSSSSITYYLTSTSAPIPAYTTTAPSTTTVNYDTSEASSISTGISAYDSRSSSTSTTSTSTTQVSTTESAATSLSSTSTLADTNFNASSTYTLTTSSEVEPTSTNTTFTSSGIVSTSISAKFETSLSASSVSTENVPSDSSPSGFNNTKLFRSNLCSRNRFGVSHETCKSGYTLFRDAETTCESGHWNPTLGTCQQDCPALTNHNATNGNISTDNVTDGTNVTLTCEEGYTLFGYAETTCLSGDWKPPLGTCKQDCPALTNYNDTNGNISTDNVTDGTNVTLTCEEGYTLFGDAETTCLSGEWKPPLGTCKQDCPALTNYNDTNGNISTDNVTDGTNVTLTCEEGYTLFGDDETTCLSGGWKPPLGTCKQDCQALTNSNDTNGNISTDNVTDGTNVTLTCEEGYTLFGDAETTCLSGEWRPPLGTCKQDCPAFTNYSDTNGNISTDNVTDGTNVTLTCEEGYTLFGDDETTCLSGGWKPPLGTCKQDCPALTNYNDTNGNISTDNVTDGTNVTLTCEEGYTLFGDDETTCLSGEWKPPLGTCKQDCPALTNYNDTNGNISTDNVTDGTNVTLTCEEGYTLFGDDETTCLSGGWKPPLGTCKQDCPALTNSNDTNGNISTDNVTDGTNVTLTCEEGYTLFGDDETTCLSGEWKPPLGTCKQDCPALTNYNDTNGNISTDNVTDGTSVTLTCEEGYTLFGDAVTTCLYGEWKPLLGTCKQDCPALTNYNDTNSNISNDNVTDGTNVTLTCEEGYTLFGDAETTCLSGEWKPPLGTCKQDCPALTNYNDTNGNISTDNVTDGTNVTLTCEEGYTLFGDAVTTCLYGEWKPPIGTCKQDCPALTNYNDTNGKISTDNVTDGTNVRVTCEEGYTLFGDAETICLSGEWKPPLGTCKQVPDKPSNCSSAKSSSYEIVLIWTPVSTTWFTEYKVECGDCSSPESLPKDQTNITMSNLSSNTEYEFNISTVANFNCTPKACILQSRPCIVSSRTAPASPVNVSFKNYTETSLTVLWVPGDNDMTDIIFIVELSGDGDKKYTYNTTDVFYKFDNLTSGTLYSVNVTAVFHGNRSDEDTIQSLPSFNSTYTRPSKLKDVSMTAASESSITLELDSNDPRFSSMWLHLNDTTSASDCFIIEVLTNFTRNLTCNNLTSTTVYSITVYTQIGGIYSFPYTKDVNTAPYCPNASVIEVEDTSVTIKLSEWNEPLRYYYLLSTDMRNATIENTTFHVDKLSPGTYNTITIYSSFRGWPCSLPWKDSLFTVPSMVRSVTIDPVSSTALNISWVPGEGGYEYFIIKYNCSSPDEPVLNVTDDNTTELFVVKSGLLPGSKCNVSVTVHAGIQNSGPYWIIGSNTTFETAPSMVANLRVDTVVNEPNRLSVSWEEPETKNGIIRAYVVVVYKENESTAMYHFTCTDCTEASIQHCEFFNASPQSNIYQRNFSTTKSTFNCTIDNLLPYTQYTVNVTAVTACEGPTISIANKTDEDVPSAPGDPTLIEQSQTSMTFGWDDPDPPNGDILEYMIIYEYYERVCRGYGIERTENETILLSDIYNTSDIHNNTHTLHSLYSFWNYTITIIASTSKGYGNRSVSKIFTTDEAEPGVIDLDNITETHGSRNISLKWLPPCFPNGRIVNYSISWIDKDKPSGKGSTISDIEELTFTDKLPYRNYSFQIAAVNRRYQGPYTDEFDVQTEIEKPPPPNLIGVTALNSTVIEVEWKKMKDDQYTGPTIFTAKAYDSLNSSSVYQCLAEGFNATRCFIDKLDEFWNYTVEVIAKTEALNNSLQTTSNGSLEITTKEDSPGPVQNIVTIPESNVTKKRSINVSWDRPIQRDLNGILTEYFITYEFDDSGSVATQRVKSDARSIILTHDIKPGNYNITVFAANAAGNGTIKSAPKLTVVSPGAPIRPEESASIQIVQKATVEDIDSKTELAVSLNRQYFLCDTTNGNPTMWGVIVAQASEAIGKPFFGSKGEFDNVLSGYKSWFDVKDSDAIVPYRATDKNWNPACGSTENRSKRSTNSSTSQELSPLQFIVGRDKECEGKSSGFCNGQLPSGRSYKVKSFVCTDGGCTETEYSDPIQTEAKVVSRPKTDSDPTVAIVAGMVSGVAVVACVLVVLFLKRRGKVCFAKTVEEPIFEPEIELEGTSHFRPIAVKLVDFPAYVEALHRDSDLLFADGFRLLKEQSPSHPTTVAEIQACRPKTRYTNILPFDHSRVKLLPLDDEEGSDFINANFIPGYTSRREYIATQGPMPATKDDFWRMVWEQNVDIIVMLTRCMEKGKRKCDEYWPEVVQEPVFSGDLVLNVQSESTLSDYVIRIIEVKLKAHTRTVRQLQYLKWPDMGSPDDTDMLLSFVKTVRELIRTGGSNPIVVHCSAGVGRTGTFIAVDRLLQHIRDHDEVDVYSTVLDMRNYRCNMVQTEDQFVYIYECIKDFITTDNEEEEEEEEHLYENTRFEENVYANTAFQGEPF